MQVSKVDGMQAGVVKWVAQNADPEPQQFSTSLCILVLSTVQR
jgi:hypothetical protein